MDVERKSHPEKEVERAVHKGSVGENSELSAGTAILRRNCRMKWETGVSKKRSKSCRVGFKGLI